MSTLKKLMHDSEIYFDELPNSIQDTVRKLILEAAANRKGPEGYKLDDECIEEVECRRRDGFIPYSHNKGGIEYRNFTDLMGYFGGGYSVAHAKADAEIQRQIDYSFEYLRGSVYEQFEELLDSHGITKDDCNYHWMYEAARTHDDLKPVLRAIEDGETECLGSSEDTIMHSIRFMYHGKEDGLHSASVSAAINTEGPYHRQSIPWAPGIFCEGASEVEITWRNTAELKRKLSKALNKVTKAVF